MHVNCPACKQSHGELSPGTYQCPCKAQFRVEKNPDKSWEGIRCRRCGTNLQNGKCPIQGRKKDDCPGNKPWKPGER